MSYSADELENRIKHDMWVSPPDQSIIAGMDPKVYTGMLLVAARTIEERAEHFTAMQSLSESQSMTQAFARLAQLSPRTVPGGSIGVANIAMALLIVAYMTLEGSAARLELQAHCIGSGALDEIARLLTSPCRSAMLMTFDSDVDDEEERVNGCTTNNSVANAIKAHIVKTLGGQASVMNRRLPDAQAIADVNAFCNAKTRGKIPKIIDELDPGAKAVIVAAEYIQVEWSTVMDKAPSAPFNGVRNTIAYQDYAEYNDHYLPTWRDDSTGCVAVKVETKPVPGDWHRSMVFILPPSTDERESYFECAKSLRTDKFVSTKYTRFAIPIVDIATNMIDGKKLLRDAGVDSIFESLDAMAPFFHDPSGRGGVKVARVVHASCIKWNRFGAEAAAATLVECVYRSLAAHPSIVFDRPFLAVLGFDTDDGAFIPEFFAEVTGEGADDSLGRHDPDDFGY